MPFGSIRDFDIDSKIDMHDRLVREKLIRERASLVDRMNSLTGEAKATAEKRLADVDARLADLP